MAMFMRCGKAMEHDERGGQRGQGKASGKRTTQLEGGGSRQRKASRWRTTQQEGRRCNGRRWWNPPVLAHQSPLRREKEGRGPIVVKAREQSTTTVDANTLFHDGAARQRHWDPR